MKTKNTFKNQINAIAISYYKESNKAKKFGLMLKAEKLIKSYEFSSYSNFLKDFGFSYFAGINSSQKIIKGVKENFNTLVLYLSATNNAGKNVCSHASIGCILACLEDSGQAALDVHKKIPTVKPSRIKKTWISVFRKDLAEKVLSHEIEKGIRKSKKQRRKFAVRLNGTSDLEWDQIYTRFPEVQFYDYTKNPNRAAAPNYHVTYSYADMSEKRIAWYVDAIRKGQNLAIPVIKEDFNRILDALPETFSMDSTDLRFLDAAEGSYGILIAKLTKGMQGGIEKDFILNFEQVVFLISTIENRITKAA